MRLKKKAPIVAGVVAFTLAIVKLVVGMLSGSIAVIASAIDSTMDSVISLANFFVADKSGKDPDNRFNYGYAKLEAMMSFVEGIFVFGVGVFLLVSSIGKCFKDDLTIKVDIAFYVMCFSSFVTFFLVRYLQRAYRKTNSLVIKADILHYKTDLFTNLGIALSLVVIHFTGLLVVDIIVGLLIALYIMLSAVKLILQSGRILIDEAVSLDIVDDIKQYISSHPEKTSFHDFKTRKSVDKCYLTAHLVFNRDISLMDAHAIGDDIETYIAKTYAAYAWDINLHFDPYDDRIATD